MQEGGHLLGQGTYGCVFDPPLLCDKSKRKPQDQSNLLGKITLRGDFINEKNASEILESVPNWDRYFVLIDSKSICNMAPVQKQADKKSIFGCEVFRKYGTDQMIHFTMEYGGISIDKMLKKIQAVGVFPTFDFFKHTLEAGTLLALKRFSHYDIHGANVLVDEKTLMPRLIDFGMSFDANTITDEVLDSRWKKYDPFFPQEPPEITIITGIRHGLSAKQALIDVSREKVSLRNAEVQIGLSRVKQSRAFIRFWNASAAVKDRDWLAFFKVYWPAFDSWGIGVYLLSIFRTLKTLQVSDLNEMQARIKGVLQGLLRMDPLERLDCVEALSLWDPDNAIFEREDAQRWLEQREASRAKVMRGA
jgi:hypothetical protein